MLRVELPLLFLPSCRQRSVATTIGGFANGRFTSLHPTKGGAWIVTSQFDANRMVCTVGTFGFDQRERLSPQTKRPCRNCTSSRWSPCPATAMRAENSKRTTT